MPAVAVDEKKDQRWRTRAACRGEPTFLWFSSDPFEAALARRICTGCAVRAECAAYADALGAEGVWGGRLRRSYERRSST